MKSAGRLPWPAFGRVAAAACSAVLVACGSAPSKADKDPGLLDAALKVVGLQRAEEKTAAAAMPDMALPKLRPATLPLRLHAGHVLNTDGQGRSLPLIAKVYHLRAADAFLQAPYAAFGDEAREKAALRGDLVDAREVLLKPGARHEAVQALSPEVRYIGVVGLFRAPAEHRWRFALDTEASSGGIVLGAHGCALSVAQGTPVGAAPETTRLAGVQCD